eukprot:scaffold22585_cov149-Cylindrotheca_fusiformis.AAC.2
MTLCIVCHPSILRPAIQGDCDQRDTTDSTDYGTYDLQVVGKRQPGTSNTRCFPQVRLVSLTLRLANGSDHQQLWLCYDPFPDTKEEEAPHEMLLKQA